MTQVINWCTAHLQELLAIIGGLVGVATVVVKLTPTQKDDAFLGPGSPARPRPNRCR